jgi:RNA polymerase sigma-70 factor (ECF subfamily)
LADKKKKISPDAERALEEYGNSLYRLCSVMTGNREDAQDAVQECFLRYITKAPDFNDSEHEKAWLIRVASNLCCDILRKRKHESFVCLDEIRNLGTSEDNAQILGLLMSLEEKYRIVMHLHYVEEYKVDELSSLLGITSAAVKKRLQRGREALREIYEKEAG